MQARTEGSGLVSFESSAQLLIMRLIRCKKARPQPHGCPESSPLQDHIRRIYSKMCISNHPRFWHLAEAVHDDYDQI